MKWEFFFFGKKGSSRLIPEFEELEYFVQYPSPPNSGTNMPVFYNLPRLVPKFGELRYFIKYPSPPNSGTNLSVF